MFINTKTALLSFFHNAKLFPAVGYIVTVTHSLFTSPRNPSRFAGQRYISRHPLGCVYTAGWEAWSLTPSPWACGQLLSLLRALFYLSKSGFNHSYPFSKASNPHPPCTVTCGWSKSLTLNRAAAKSADRLCSHPAQKLISLWGFGQSCKIPVSSLSYLWKWGGQHLKDRGEDEISYCAAISCVLIFVKYRQLRSPAYDHSGANLSRLQFPLWYK